MKGVRSKNYVNIMSYNKKVTGSSHFLEINYDDGLTINGIVDCGLFQEREYLELNKKLPFDASELDFFENKYNSSLRLKYFCIKSRNISEWVKFSDNEINNKTNNNIIYFNELKKSLK